MCGSNLFIGLLTAWHCLHPPQQRSAVLTLLCWPMHPTSAAALQIVPHNEPDPCSYPPPGSASTARASQHRPCLQHTGRCCEQLPCQHSSSTASCPPACNPQQWQAHHAPRHGPSSTPQHTDSIQQAVSRVSKQPMAGAWPRACSESCKQLCWIVWRQAAAAAAGKHDLGAGSSCQV